MRRSALIFSLFLSLVPAVASATPPAPSAPPPHPSAPAPHPSAPAPHPSAPPHVATPAPSVVHVTTPPPATIHVTPAAVAESKPVHIPAYVPPPPGADHATLVAASKALIARQVARTESMLPTTGYTSLAEVAEKTAALGPQRAAAVEMLKAEDKLEFTMRTPSQIRESITARGFLNQHDVKTSRGTLDPNTRATVEASFLGVTRPEYDQLPNSVKPKYGYLRPAKETHVSMNDGATQYGDDIFVFKHDALKDHTTVFPDDSLGKSAAGWPARPDAVPTKWHHTLIPWADRMLLAPQMEVTAANQLNHSGYGTAAPPPGFTGLSGSRYLEIQIWRPIGIEDVERFEFSSTPPSGEFLKALRTNNVKIFQVGAPAEWHGDAPAPAAPTSFRIGPRSRFVSSSLAGAFA